jgi:hypothetical protein
LAFAKDCIHNTVSPCIVSAIALGFIVKPVLNISGRTIKSTAPEIVFISASK